MNYLAHLCFATQAQNSLFGNLLGDFVKGQQHGYTDSTILQGLQLHRDIDKFTDNHAIVRQSKQRISNNRRRYAGIMIDVFYDHFLAVHWNDYFSSDFQQQTQQWYQILNQPSDTQLPSRMQRVIKLMQQDDWLGMYQHWTGIDQAINGIAQRIRFQNRLAGGALELTEHYAPLESDFHNFFPDLQKYVAHHTGS